MEGNVPHQPGGDIGRGGPGSPIEDARIRSLLMSVSQSAAAAAPLNQGTALATGTGRGSAAPIRTSRSAARTPCSQMSAGSPRMERPICVVTHTGDVIDAPPPPESRAEKLDVARNSLVPVFPWLLHMN